MLYYSRILQTSFCLYVMYNRLCLLILDFSWVDQLSVFLPKKDVPLSKLVKSLLVLRGNVPLSIQKSLKSSLLRSQIVLRSCRRA